jgi:hypothetical protein
MVLAFLSSIGILTLGLFASIEFSNAFSSSLIDGGSASWFIVPLAGAATSAAVGRLYDAGFSVARPLLPFGLPEYIFSIAALVVVMLLLAYTHGYPVYSMPIKRDVAPMLTVVILATYIACCWELYTLLPVSIDWLFRSLLAVSLALLLILVVWFAPAYLVASALKEFNAGAAACVAGWVAGVCSRQVKKHSVDLQLESKAAGQAVAGLIQREGAVVFAVVIAYIAFRITSAPNILFSVVVGLVTPFATLLLSTVLVQNSTGSD